MLRGEGGGQQRRVRRAPAERTPPIIGRFEGSWHRRQQATRLEGWSLPPSTRGMRWSTVVAQAPQYWQVCRSRARVRSRMRRQARVEPLSPSALRWRGTA